MTEENTKMAEVVDKGMRKDILWTIKMAMLNYLESIKEIITMSNFY